MQDKKQDPTNNDAAVRPDRETSNTTDPQENMKGPVSSTMHEAGKGFDTEETKREADKKKEERM